MSLERSSKLLQLLLAPHLKPRFTFRASFGHKMITANYTFVDVAKLFYLNQTNPARNAIEIQIEIQNFTFYLQ